MSTLLQDVLRSKTTADSKLIERKLNSLSFSSIRGANNNPPSHNNNSDDSDDELVNVVSFFSLDTGLCSKSMTFRYLCLVHHPELDLHHPLEAELLLDLSGDLCIYHHPQCPRQIRLKLCQQKFHRRSLPNYP